MIHLMRTKEEYRLQISKIGFDGLMMKQIIQNGVPSGFQNSVISIANVFVQTNINAFGKMAMAGCGSYSKIEGFAFLPVTCFTMALTTFVSQNLGAKQYDRAKKGCAVWHPVLHSDRGTDRCSDLCGGSDADRGI